MDRVNQTRKKNPKISIVVPAHNEEENLEILVKELLKITKKSSLIQDFELVIVNDNSTDGTPLLIENFSKQNLRIKAVHRTDSPGFGNAIKVGFRNASGDIIIPVMADLSENPDDIPKLVQKIEEGYDIAYGSRFCKGGYIDEYPMLKLLFNRLGNYIIHLLYGLPHKDFTNAFKAYRKEVLEKIGIENLDSNDFDLTIEIPIKAHILGFKSAEVPVSWYGRKRGKANLKLHRQCHRYCLRLLKLFIFCNIMAIKNLLHRR